MSAYHRACFVFSLTALSGASSVLTVVSGADESTYTSALYFNYAFGGAAIGTAVAASTASCDVLAAWTNAATLTLTYGTYSTFMLVVEIDSTDMDLVTGGGEPWLSCVFTTTTSVAGTVTGIAILEPRYKGNRLGTCLK